MSAEAKQKLEKYLHDRIQSSSRLTIALIISAFAAIIICDRMVVIVRSGDLGVIWSFFSGTVQQYVLTEGINFVSPLNEVFIYDMKIQSIDKKYSLQTREGLNIDANVNIRVRPDYRALPALHQMIGQGYVDKIVIPSVEGIVRQIFGRYTAEQIYSGVSGLSDNLVVSALEAIQSKHIIVESVTLKSIVIPEVLKNSIESKLSLEQESQSYKYKIDMANQEAKRKIIEAHGINDSQKIISQSLSSELLRWHGIVATRELSNSSNAKTVIYGAGRDGLPLIMNDKQ